MLLVELSGATFLRVFEDGAKIAAPSAGELYAYETPLEGEDSDASDLDDVDQDDQGTDHPIPEPGTHKSPTSIVQSNISCSVLFVEIVLKIVIYISATKHYLR